MRFSSLQGESLIAFLLASYTAAAPTTDLSADASPQALSFPLQRRSAGAVYTQDYGYEWTVPVLVGGQTFNVRLDTGSSGLWLYSIAVPANQRGSHALYDISHGRIVSGETWTIQYVGDMDPTSGVIVKDTVDIGGILMEMPFQAATNVGYDRFDGVLGLTFGVGGPAKPTKQPTFMESVQHLLYHPVFAIDLKTNASGTLNFGGTNPAAYTGKLQTVKVDNSTSFWKVPNVTFTVGSLHQTLNVTFDTGAATTSLDPATVQAYWAQVAGAKRVGGVGMNWQAPCDAKLPDLTFQTPSNPGVVHAIPGPQLLGGPAAGSANMCSTNLISPACGPYCYSIGAPFFTSHYVVFNQAVPSIAFALQA